MGEALSTPHGPFETGFAERRTEKTLDIMQSTEVLYAFPVVADHTAYCAALSFFGTYLAPRLTE